MLSNDMASPLSESIQSQWLQAMFRRVLQNPLAGTQINHFRAEWVDPVNFDDRGRADYLAADAGIYDSGVNYTPNPCNPLLGIFCAPRTRPTQDKAGMTYQAEMEIYLATDPGEVFVLDGTYPKKQDRFDINGTSWYAIAPALPCLSGSVTAMYKVQLTRQRYPVGPNHV